MLTAIVLCRTQETAGQADHYDGQLPVAEPAVQQRHVDQRREPVHIQTQTVPTLSGNLTGPDRSEPVVRSSRLLGGEGKSNGLRVARQSKR